LLDYWLRFHQLPMREEAEGALAAAVPVHQVSRPASSLTEPAAPLQGIPEHPVTPPVI
jgi:hypothetical protein